MMYFPFFSFLLFFITKRYIYTVLEVNLKMTFIWKIYFKINMKRKIDTMWWLPQFSKLNNRINYTYLLFSSSRSNLYATDKRRWLTRYKSIIWSGYNAWIKWNLLILFQCNTKYFECTFSFLANCYEFLMSKKISKAVFYILWNNALSFIYEISVNQETFKAHKIFFHNCKIDLWDV